MSWRKNPLRWYENHQQPIARIGERLAEPPHTQEEAWAQPTKLDAAGAPHAPKKVTLKKGLGKDLPCASPVTPGLQLLSAKQRGLAFLWVFCDRSLGFALAQPAAAPPQR